MSHPTDYGVAQCVSDLAADQVRRGWSVAVASPTDGWLAEAVTAAGARHVPWRAGRELGPSAAAETRRLARVIAGVAPDVLHLHSSKASLAGRLAVRGAIPTLVQTHAWSFLALDGPRQRLAVSWERLAARWALSIVCCGPEEAEIGRRHGILSPLKVVPNSVDLDRFSPGDDHARQQARTDLGLGPAPLVVCVSRLWHQKGQDVLLRAWPRVRAEIPEAELAVVGDGPEQADLEGLLTPGARLAGRSDRVDLWLRAANLVVLPSRYEGMSLALLQAMASGRSVVVTDGPGVAEPMQGSLPPAGAVVPVEDEAALALETVRRLADPALAETEGKAGRAHAERFYGLAAWLDAMASLTEEAAATGRRRGR